MNKLKIYACSGVGDAQSSNLAQYETEDTNTLRNTRAMNILLALANNCRATVLYDSTLTQEVRQSYLDSLDLYTVSFYFARLYTQDAERLSLAGEVIQTLLTGKAFDSKVSDIAKHADICDTIIAQAEKIIDDPDSVKLADSGTFLDWWREIIEPNNFVYLDEQLAKSIGDLSQFGIEEDSDLSKYLTQASEYFLYFMCLTEGEAKDISRTVWKKWKKQREVYEYCHMCFDGIYGTPDTMDRIIRVGLYEHFKMSPSQLRDGLLSGGIKGVGIATEIIVAIITAITTIVLSVLSAVIDYATKVTVAKYTQPEDADAGLPDLSDFDGMDKKPDSEDKNTAMLVGAGILAAFFLLD